MAKGKGLLWLMLLVCSFSVEAVSKVKNIRYMGNDVTQESVLDREIYIHEGDIINEDLIEKSRQGIMNLGLFKTVKYYLEENYEAGQSDEKESLVDVVFVVEEKYYLLIIPRARSDDNEIHLGVQLHWDNVWGLNHSMRVVHMDRGNTEGVDELSDTASYFYRNVNSSSFNAGLSLQSVNAVDETNGVIDRQDEIIEISVSRWLNKQARNHGNFVGVRLRQQQRFNDVLAGSEISSDIDAVVLGLDIGYKDVNNYEYNRGGKDYGYKLDFSDESFGSENEFVQHQLYYRSYYRFSKRPSENLNVQMEMGHANEKVLDQDAFSLGGKDLRGYEKSRFTGNTKFLMNIEHMFPHPEYSVIRYVYFIDIGNTTNQIKELFHEPLNVGVGFGFRWKVKALVNIDLRADFGYGFTDEDYRFTFGTRHAF